jgi:hypothetical protein
MLSLTKRPDLLEIGDQFGIDYPRAYEVNGTWFLTGTLKTQPCTFKVVNGALLYIQSTNGIESFTDLVERTHGMESQYLRLLE